MVATVVGFILAWFRRHELLIIDWLPRSYVQLSGPPTPFRYALNDL